MVEWRKTPAHHPENIPKKIPVLLALLPLPTSRGYMFQPIEPLLDNEAFKSKKRCQSKKSIGRKFRGSIFAKKIYKTKPEPPPQDTLLVFSLDNKQNEHEIWK